MTLPDKRYQEATRETIESLQLVANSISDQKLTRLSLPEIEAVVDLVGKVIPAGNVPGMILSGLTRISGRQVQPQKARQDINILFKEVSFFLEQAKYGTMFATPAAIIWGYQNLLRLAGKDPESAFPEGIWQFYVDYALREDTARHINETRGFDALLNENDFRLSDVDRLTAWVMASITSLHHYHQLLACEWHERTAIWLLQELTTTKDLYTNWERQKPYGRDSGAANYDYPTYRRLKFDDYLKPTLEKLSERTFKEWRNKLQELTEQSLLSYQKQMSILAYLEPGSFGETRIPIPLGQVQLGIIRDGNYYLLPICEPGTDKPLDVRTARSQIANLLLPTKQTSPSLIRLARIQRTELQALRKKLNPTLQQSLAVLRLAPILINADRSGSSKNLLAEIRQGERGVGDHALTIFDTGTSFVFDQSHIFFDGAWGTALAEIMTNEALSWAVYLNLLSPALQAETMIYTTLSLSFDNSDTRMIQAAPKVLPEVGAESDKVDIKASLELKRYFKERSDDLRLTINDLLVLYRAIHAATYQPSKNMVQALDEFAAKQPGVGSQIKLALNDFNDLAPAILIPVDASKQTPRDRVYPMNMEVPLATLDLLHLHNESMQALSKYISDGRHDKKRFAHFDKLQRRYLATLGGFGTILAKAKEIAVRGESASVGAIKLMAHLPAPVKQMLDMVPARYAKLNNLLKGTEVLSNLGAMAKSSSVSRFSTAKDDNAQKQLAWGVMTDAQGVLHISLRDFRQHVGWLRDSGRNDLANLIAQDYLNSYVQGYNQYIREVTQIAVARPLDSSRRND